LTDKKSCAKRGVRFGALWEKERGGRQLMARKIAIRLIGTFSVLIVMTGCTLVHGKVTGAGNLDGTNGRATIAFNGDSCDDVVKGKFEFIDHDSGENMHGDVVAVTVCGVEGACTLCGNSATLGAYEIVATYRSMDPDRPGTGELFACVSDNGEGAHSSGPDTASIQVLSGPFVGYTNSGVVRGNIQQHKCPKGSTF